MNINMLKCPGCGSGLKPADDMDQFYCENCGLMVQINGLSEEWYKSRIRIKELEHEERIKGKEIELEKMRLKQQEKSEQRGFIHNLLKNDVISGLLGFVVLFIILGLLGILAKNGVIK